MDILILSTISLMIGIPMMSLTMGLIYQLTLYLSTLWIACQDSLLFREEELLAIWAILLSRPMGRRETNQVGTLDRVAAQVLQVHSVNQSITKKLYNWRLTIATTASNQ